MFKPNTVLIVGAGASKEVNLPLGSDLVEEIASLVEFQGDEFTGRLRETTPLVLPMLNYAGRDKVRRYQEAARQMIAGMRSAESVDRFIDRNRDDEFIRTLGKAAIVQSIAQAERNSKLSDDIGAPIRGRSEVDDTWYWTFVKMLLEGSPPPEKLFDDIAVVCFNYDRCIEHYLTCELMRSYHIDRTEAARLVSRLTIWHPYGTIAPLNTQDPNGIAYGDDEASRFRCFHLAERLRTFTEKHDGGEMIKAIRARLQAAETVIFLGFGYYGENLELIRPDRPTNIVWILGTGFGLSSSARGIVTSLLQSWSGQTGHPVEVTDMKCAELLNYYRMALSASPLRA